MVVRHGSGLKGKNVVGSELVLYLKALMMFKRRSSVLKSTLEVQ